MNKLILLGILLLCVGFVSAESIIDVHYAYNSYDGVNYHNAAIPYPLYQLLPSGTTDVDLGGVIVTTDYNISSYLDCDHLQMFNGTAYCQGPGLPITCSGIEEQGGPIDDYHYLLVQRTVVVAEGINDITTTCIDSNYPGGNRTSPRYIIEVDTPDSGGTQFIVDTSSNDVVGVVNHGVVTMYPATNNQTILPSFSIAGDIQKFLIRTWLNDQWVKIKHIFGGI